MKSILRYRIAGLLLVGIFTVFNIGLPVVVVSCTMTKYTDAPSCRMCNDEASNGALRFTNSTDKFCCATKYAADKNTNEFLKTDPHSVESVKLISTAELYVVPHTVIDTPQFLILSHAYPPGSADIPILISSLLI